MLAQARLAGDREAESAALHALGFARLELGDPRAMRTLRAAVRVAEQHGLHRRAALARRPLAAVLAYSGAIAAARRELDAAAEALDGLELARLEVSRLAVLGIAGVAPPSLESTGPALRTLRRSGDTLWEARLLKNRGVQRAERGDPGGERDLERARNLYARLGADEAAQGAEAELCRIALLRGDLPGCLARLDALVEKTRQPLARAALEVVRAQALLAAGLEREARAALEAGRRLWERAGADEPETRLELVRLTLRTGDAAAAEALGRRACRSFALTRRPVYRARAVGLTLAAAIAAGTVRAPALRPARAAAEALARAGWRREALRVRLLVARAAIELGRLRVAREELASCAALRRGGEAADRISRHYVEARIRLCDGDRAGALRSLRAGLDLLDRHRATLGAIELQASASALGVELAQLGLELAVERRDPLAVLAWAERLRASALRLPPVLPARDREARTRETELRAVGLLIRRGAAGGRPQRAAIARRSRLEDEIRRRSRHASGSTRRPAGRTAALELVRSPGARAFVELVEHEGRLLAVACSERRRTLLELGETAAIVEELDWLRFALGRLARAAAGESRPRSAVEASAERLDALLARPILAETGARPIVVVPIGPLHCLPWPLLPSLKALPVVVAPSLGAWHALGARTSSRRGGRRVLIAGPRLRHARSEVRSIAGVLPEATVLAGREATAARVLQELDGAALAHVACHGRFRADSPLFSSLELADGPLNAYELQRLRRPPGLVVLSACDLALSTSQPGDELLGLATALLALGTRTVVASVVPVPDAAARRLTLAFHRNLAAGDGPAEALAQAQAAQISRNPAVGGFLCLGRG